MWTFSKLIGVFSLGIVLICVTSLVTTADAFCGFYIAKADTKLFNKASKVAIVRHDNKTVITMVNDYQGDPQEFALVIPVPTVLERDQIHVTEPAIIDHLDAYTAPRLVEYFDPDPCRMVLYKSDAPQSTMVQNAESDARQNAAALGVTIEAQYTVGEYDILILSAQESSGLETWLIGFQDNLPLFIAAFLAVILIAGMLADIVANLIILGPTLLAAADKVGISDTQASMVICVGFLLGTVTPPVGICFFVAARIAEEKLERVAVALLPFIAAEALLLVMIFVIPGLTGFIPRLAGFS